MNVSQTGATALEKNIEVSALFMLVSEVENTALDEIQFLQTRQERYREVSQDAA